VYCHRVTTQLQLINISYHIISYHIISYHISYHIIISHIVSYRTVYHVMPCRVVSCHKSNECYTTCVCICSLRYPACNAHAQYCQLWLSTLYSMIPHYLIKSMIFERKKLLNIKCVLVSLKRLSGTVFILRTIERHMIKNVH
jgi:hypothetical protein